MPSDSSAPKPRVAVSACLLGQPVRYDGKDKNCTDLQALAEHCELIPVCPEVGMGLPVPRPPIEVWRSPNGLGLRPVDEPATELGPQMRRWFASHQDLWRGFDGYVLKSRSPSCGYGSTPVYTDAGQLAETADGLFVSLLREHLPELVLIDEKEISVGHLRDDFVRRVQAAHKARLRKAAKSPTASDGRA